MNDANESVLQGPVGPDAPNLEALALRELRGLNMQLNLLAEFARHQAGALATGALVDQRTGWDNPDELGTDEIGNRLFRHVERCFGDVQDMIEGDGEKPDDFESTLIDIANYAFFLWARSRLGRLYPTPE